jgi:UDPglucose--hexose-1-phosphate uridylyltransferase
VARPAGSKVDGEGGFLMHKTVTQLADGRELIYFDHKPGRGVPPPDRRTLPPRPAVGGLRHDLPTGDWVVVAGHRQDRTFLPADDECPLCPSRDGHHTEIPAADYDVVVFENRFPALAGATGEPRDAPGTGGLDDAASRRGGPHRGGQVHGGSHPDGPYRGGGPAVPVLRSAPANGRCEVICFASDHDISFASLDPDQVRLVLEAWTDRSADLAARPDIAQVYCFENRGREIGVTQPHPHGQIYAYPFVTGRTARMLDTTVAHRRRHGANLFEDLLAAEREAGTRVVAGNAEWTAFVPFAARWPYEVHLYPNRRRADLAGLDEAARSSFPEVYLDLLRRFDRLFDTPAPYIAAWHQAPAVAGATDEFAVHLELFTNRRSSSRLKYLAGTEAGMDVFSNDIVPEQAAQRLREVGP